MLTLAIDTSTKICSVALFDSNIGLLAETNLYVKKNHSNVVMGLIDSLFKNAELNIKDVDRIAVSSGPGSFTGVRIAMGLAKGFCLSLNIPLFVVSELDILEAIAEKREEKIIPLIDAKKERVYYKKNNFYGDASLVDVIEEFKDKEGKIIFVGDGAINYKRILKRDLGDRAIILSKFNSTPRATILAELSLEREEVNVYLVEPEYINKSQAEKSKIKV